MTAETLKAMRTHCNVTQSEFANWMGVPFRTYQDLEAGESQVRPIHLSAAKYAIILLANVGNSGVQLPPELEETISQALRYSQEREKRQGLAYSKRTAINPLPQDFK